MKNGKGYVIAQLNELGIYESMENEPLENLDYYTLRSMLAVKMAVAE